jgi:hypothetical protein
MWYDISLDELQHNEGMKRVHIDEPRKQALKLVEIMVAEVLERLGVDTSLSDEDVQQQQRMLEIDVREMDETQLQYVCSLTKKAFNPKALGFYIYQHGDPVAFSDPYIQDGKVKVSVEPYDGRVVFGESAFRLVRRGNEN